MLEKKGNVITDVGHSYLQFFASMIRNASFKNF